MDVSDTVKAFGISVPSTPLGLELDPKIDIFRRLHREEIPPTLSQTLGADSALIVVSESEAPEIAEKFRNLAETWADNETIEWDSELEVGELPRDMAIWFLGETKFMNQLMRSIPDELQINETEWRCGEEMYTADGKTGVFTLSSPYDTELSWTLVLSDDPTAFESVSAKLPHYGKYSYLVFEGSNNIGKGVWRADESPLRVSF
jgi:hypothetical protein